MTESNNAAASSRVSDEQIIAVARALCKRTAEVCGVDADDHWRWYSEDFKEDARCALIAAASAAPAAVVPADPLDTPLPCDVTVGHGTMRKGVALRTLVLRMKSLYEMATSHTGDVGALVTGHIALKPQYQRTARGDAVLSEVVKWALAGHITDRGVTVEACRAIRAVADGVSPSSRQTNNQENRS